jgi:hypothetical protein
VVRIVEIVLVAIVVVLVAVVIAVPVTEMARTALGLAQCR